jgi:hypothetical protein
MSSGDASLLVSVLTDMESYTVQTRRMLIQ